MKTFLQKYKVDGDFLNYVQEGNHVQVAGYALKLGSDIAMAWENNATKVARTPRWVRWIPPVTGWMALNTDGAVKSAGMA